MPTNERLRHTCRAPRLSLSLHLSCYAFRPEGPVSMNDIGDIIASLRSAMPALRRQWPIGSLALFGSRVRDDATPVSDLDVLVEFTRPVPLSSFLALEERLAAITGLRVDLVSEAALKPYMGKHIRAEAVTV